MSVSQIFFPIFNYSEDPDPYSDPEYESGFTTLIKICKTVGESLKVNNESDPKNWPVVSVASECPCGWC